MKWRLHGKLSSIFFTIGDCKQKYKNHFREERLLYPLGCNFLSIFDCFQSIAVVIAQEEISPRVLIFAMRQGLPTESLKKGKSVNRDFFH